MMTPHLCPKCHGEARVLDAFGTALDRACPVCNGARVLWGPPAVSLPPSRLMFPSTFTPMEPCVEKFYAHDFEWTSGKGITVTFTTNPKCKRCGKLLSELQAQPVTNWGIGPIDAQSLAEMTRFGEPRAPLQVATDPTAVQHPVRDAQCGLPSPRFCGLDPDEDDGA